MCDEQGSALHGAGHEYDTRVTWTIAVAWSLVHHALHD